VTQVNALVDLLRGDHEGQKVLIFSEYKDTAEYVASALEAAGVDNVGLATGDVADPSDVARRFSPRSIGSRAKASARWPSPLTPSTSSLPRTSSQKARTFKTVT
jgi:hypothetical protein